MTEFFGKDHVFGVEMVVRVNYFVREISFLLVFLELSDLDEESADISDEVSETHKGNVLNIIFKLTEKGILTVCVAVIEVYDGKEQSLVEKFSPTE